MRHWWVPQLCCATLCLTASWLCATSGAGFCISRGLQCQLLSTCIGSMSATASAGINTAIYSPSGGSAGVGFAIPIDLVKSSVEQILQFGKVLRPVLGISFAPDQSSEQASAP